MWPKMVQRYTYQSHQQKCVQIWGCSTISVNNWQKHCMQNIWANDRLVSFCLLPDGSPHLLCGAKFFQKIEWLMWPPALKRSIDAAATAATPSPLLTHGHINGSNKHTYTLRHTSHCSYSMCGTDSTGMRTICKCINTAVCKQLPGKLSLAIPLWVDTVWANSGKQTPTPRNAPNDSRPTIHVCYCIVRLLLLLLLLLLRLGLLRLLPLLLMLLLLLLWLRLLLRLLLLLQLWLPLPLLHYYCYHYYYDYDYYTSIITTITTTVSSSSSTTCTTTTTTSPRSQSLSC